MNYLEAFRAAHLGVNWRTIAVGWDGPGKWPRLLTLDDVQTFAASAASPPPSLEPALLRILAASADETEEVARAIHLLADACRADPDRELRKWRVVLLKEQLWKGPRDPIYGLLALTEFWEKFGYPGDGPHVVQGRNDATAPNEYYSELNFRRLTQRHADWIEAEVCDLGGVDS
jgi:hypothetical protein